MKKETVADMMQRFHLTPHVEGGAFRELYRDGTERPAERPASGVIYYALGQGETSDFHLLDSDEYWLYHAGDTVELWIVGEDGHLHTERLGIEEGAEPCVLLPKNTIFGARMVPGSTDGCLMSCVTVPEFTYEHYRILSEAEMREQYPESIPFFEE